MTGGLFNMSKVLLRRTSARDARITDLLILGRSIIGFICACAFSSLEFYHLTNRHNSLCWLIANSVVCILAYDIGSTLLQGST